MGRTSRINVSNKYIIICLSCDDEEDSRMRYSTGVKEAQSKSKAGSKRIEKIKEAIDKYISEYELHKKPILRSEIESYLDKEFNPDKVLKAQKLAARNLVEDHKEMIYKMQTGQLVKKRSKTLYSDKTISQYERMRERWEECAADPKSGFVLSYDMTIDHYRNLINWMIIKEYSQNSMYNIVNNLSIFLRYSHSEGYHSNEIYKHREFSIAQEDSDAIAPKYEEVLSFYNTPLKSKSDECARDLFVFGCFLALRVEDLSRINEYKLIGNQFEIFTEKTDKKVIIPCHWLAREIYEKYNGNMPVYFRQTLARILNRICKESNAFPGEKLITMTVGGKKTEYRYQRHELITPHTMRRFFATWMYLVVGRKPREIMAITGHETEESFFKYIKIELESNAQEIYNDPAFKKPA